MEGSGLSKICLFVRNLPYSISDADLEEVFKPHGALRSCYTVKERGRPSKRCRGFAYVTYTNREDAQRALSLVKVVGGRPVQIAFARRKKAAGKPTATAMEEDENEEEEDYEALTARNGVVKRQHKAKSERGVARFDVGRVVVLRNLPKGAKEKRLRKKCERFGDVESIVVLVTSDPNGHVAHVTFSTHKSARRAVTGLDSTKYKKSSEEAIKACLLSLENKTQSSKSLKKSRLIVRNLSFRCGEEDVREIFQEYGAVLRVDIPQKQNGQMLGYAFVQFGSYFDAARAIASVNGTEVKGRKVGVDWLLPREEYQGKKEGSEGEGAEETSDGEDEAESDKRKEDDDDDDDDDEEEEEEEVGGSEESEEDEDGDEVTTKNDGVRRVRDDVSEGRTLFIRNLPITADSTVLRRLLMKYGPVRYCRLMLHTETGVPTGSAFVQFRTSYAAQTCLEAAEPSGGGVVYEGGHTLDITLALSRGDLKKTHEGGSEKGDKRNLYLTKEGAIFPGSEAAQELSKADMAKRTKAYAEKKAKLANPHFYVSKTRLCVRNLPTSVDERQLKAMFQRAASTSAVVQVKLLRSSERVDSKGVGRSMGYGFVEFSDHDSALTALRATNNNPSLFGKTKRPIVDFAVEDSRIMKIREKRLQKQLSQRAASESSAVPEDSSGGNKRLTRRRKWQLKWQSRRHKRKEASQESGEPMRRAVPSSPEAEAASRKSRKRKNQDTAAPDPEGDGVKRRCLVEERGRGRERGRERTRRLVRKKSSRTEEEERKFNEMVNKYRMKLLVT